MTSLKLVIACVVISQCLYMCTCVEDAESNTSYDIIQNEDLDKIDNELTVDESDPIKIIVRYMRIGGKLYKKSTIKSYKFGNRVYHTTRSKHYFKIFIKNTWHKFGIRYGKNGGETQFKIGHRRITLRFRKRKYLRYFTIGGRRYPRGRYKYMAIGRNRYLITRSKNHFKILTKKGWRTYRIRYSSSGVITQFKIGPRKITLRFHTKKYFMIDGKRYLRSRYKLMVIGGKKYLTRRYKSFYITIGKRSYLIKRNKNYAYLYPRSNLIKRFKIGKSG